MRKTKALLLFILISAIVTACGSSKAKSTTIAIHKDGTIDHFIVEDFGEQYNVEDLQTMMLSKIAQYNKASAGDGISASKVEAKKDGTVLVDMTYPSAADFELFNNMDAEEQATFFYGTIEDAYAQGLNLEVTLTKRGTEEETISRDEILAMGSSQICIYDNTLNLGAATVLEFPESISYYSDNVTLQDKKKAVVTDNEGSLAYIIIR